MRRRRHLVTVQDLLGRRVYDVTGRPAGRIEEMRADRHGDDYTVTKFLLGSGALFERWSIVRRLLGRKLRTYVVRWDQLDLSRPEKPSLTCRVDDLEVQ